MRNEKSHSDRCEKLTFSKHSGTCKTYSVIQLAFAQKLEADEHIAEFRCNVPLPDFELTDGSYTTDFLCTTVTGDMMVRECINRDFLLKPMTVKLLDASRSFWLRRGITDWGLVIDAL